MAIFKDPDSIAHSANLLVCIGGLATATGLTAGAGAVVGGYLSYREISKRLPSGAKRLAEELGSELQKKLSGPGLNDDTRRLIPQMIEASLPSPQRVMEAGHDSTVLVEMMAARLIDNEQRNPDHLGPFKRIVGHLLEKLLADPQFADELAPAFRKQVLADAQAIKAGIESLEQQFGTVSEALTHVGALGKANRDQLEALASRFEIDRAFAIGDAELRALLEAKAEEYRNYKAQIDMIDERIAGLGNLKAAAQEAAERLDLEEVENLLSMVHATELDIAAKTAELRADNALLRGRVGDAYRLLSAAADSFVIIGQTETARRRSTYEHRLYLHGLRYGGSGLAYAIDMNRVALGVLSEQKHPNLWAATQNSLAVALSALGTRTSGAKGAALLAEAVERYQATLRVTTEHNDPEKWAGTLMNLANSIIQQGARTEGSKGITLLADSIGYCQSALRVFNEEKTPIKWAMAYNNLAVAMAEYGTRLGGPEGIAPLAEAAEAWRAVLRVYTERNHPVDWASTQNNLANSLSTQGALTGGDRSKELFAEAVGAYRAALRVRTQNDYPVDWAATHSNLANALAEQGERVGGKEGASLLVEAVSAYHAALIIRTEREHPVEWALTLRNLAQTELAIASNESCLDPRPHLQAALDHLDAALRVYDPEHMPYYYGTATESRARIQAKLDALD